MIVGSRNTVGCRASAEAPLERYGPVFEAEVQVEQACDFETDREEATAHHCERDTFYNEREK